MGAREDYSLVITCTRRQSICYGMSWNFKNYRKSVKLEWPLIQVIINWETVVQQNQIKALHQHTDIHITVIIIITAIIIDIAALWAQPSTKPLTYFSQGAAWLSGGLDTGCQQDAQLSQRDRAAGCVIVFAKSRRLELGDNILRTL